MVECLPSKQVVAGSNPVSRSKSGRRPAMLSLPISMPVIRRISLPHMVSKPSPSPSPSLRRIASAVGARRYAVGGACLLIVAAALRFYDLGANSLWHDEAVAAIIAQGTLSEAVINAGTSYSNTSPPLYLIALWAVQKVASTEFSLRFMSAAASLLTVGALLFWMPRLGIARGAAFLAALLATLSVAAIDHAQDAREYSVDALFAVMIIAGTLQYLRDGRRALLCAGLFAAPLLQYGLIVFGVGALGAAAFSPVAASRMAAAGNSGGQRPPLAAAIWGWLKWRRDLLLPIGAFAAGCALTWALTARYQWVGDGWGSAGYLAEFYHQIGYGSSQLKFAGKQTWDLLGYHMPPEIAAAALIASGAALLIGLLRRGSFYESTLFVLMCFTVGAAIWGGLMNVYPYGGSRHNLYLGPIVFLAMGSAFHWAAVEVSGLLRRAWVGTALAAAVAVAIAVAGGAAVWQAAPYYAKDGSMAQVLAALDERKREGDAVFASRYEAPAVAFYKEGRPDNYFYGKNACWGDAWGEASWAACFPDILGEMFRMANNARRIWLVHNSSVSVEEGMAGYWQDAAYWRNIPYARDAAVEQIVGGGWTTLHLITGFDGLTADIREWWLAMYAHIMAGEPSAVSAYNLYLQYDALYYAKQPCDRADTDARFFLHIYPRDAAELPNHRRQYGFDNLDFDFYDYGIRLDDMCMIWRPLPGYAVERIIAGQFVPPNGPRVWEAELAGER